MPKPTTPSPATGPLLMLLSACMFTAMNLLLKQAMADFRVWDIGFYRFFGGLVILTAVFGRHGNPFRSPDTKLLLIRGCSGSIAFVAFVFSVRMLPVSTALMLLYSFPAFAAVFSAWLYREKVSATGWLCLVLVLVGVGLLVDPAVGGNRLGYLAGIVSAVFAGLTIAIIRRLKQSNGSVVIYLYFCAVGAAVTAPFFLQGPVLPVSTHLTGEYGIDDLYVGVPVIIGAGGAEKVIEIALDDEAKANLAVSVDAVKELLVACKGIEPSLA